MVDGGGIDVLETGEETSRFHLVGGSQEPRGHERAGVGGQGDEAATVERDIGGGHRAAVVHARGR